ncbi:ATP-grasp domain-containing protein [Acidicapsa dinghuensis]|uniref:ATP-grasp domain-containing protein n=1 Tax=Acidicapsa dinghuensis TaxID=2218256 RepID=A0ABW1ELM6_9BACT|nr:ATP-grasp domain-containing protein [Acidicapsa dinghuensis]
MATGADLLVPCDDAAVWHLHELHAKYPEMQSLIEYSLCAKEGFATIQSRAETLEAAAKLGIRVPLTRTVISEEDMENWPLDGSAVIKLDGTWGGAGVAIVDSKAKAIAEFRRLSGPVRSGVAWKRWLINRHPRSLMSLRRRREQGLTIQQFIQGHPANTMCACWQGEVLSAVTVEVLASQGQTGAAIVVRLIKNDEIDRATRLLARQFMFNGFFGLDFIIDEKTAVPYLIELNPRATQLGHLRLPGQDSLAAALIARITGEVSKAPEDCIENPIIALFPQTLNWDPDSVYLTSGHHDMPIEEPALCQELLRESWPDRQWLSRAYQYLRMPKREKMAKWS